MSNNSIFRRIGSVLLLSSLLATGSSFAVPAYRGWQTKTQPDGTTIEVRQMGDEFYHYTVNKEGKQVQLNKNGFYEVVGEQPTGEQVLARRAQSPRLAGQRRVSKNYGDLQIDRILVILVSFKNKAILSSHGNSFYTNLLNAESASVRDYFRQSSEGKYVPQFDVWGPVTLDKDYSYYGANTNNSDSHPDQMAVDACAKAYALGCDFSNYDTNNDGIVDNIYIIYAGYGENYQGADEDWIWPHSWQIYSQYVTGTLTYNGKTLGHYACSAELTGISGSTADGLGTFCHEFSHVIGLPDYYDTKYGTNYENEVTPGAWTLMDQGSYNGKGNSPALYSIYDKYFMGWKTPTILKDPENVEMPVGGDYARQITSNNTLAAVTNTNTVYYLENRQKQGYDAELPGHGMIVWRVQYNSTRWSQNDLNNTAGTLRYTIVPADGKTTGYGTASDPFPGSAVVRSYTPINGHALTEISESAGVITFKYNGGVTKTECSYELMGANCTVPSDGVIATNSPLSLTITPDEGYTLADASCWEVEMGLNNELVYGEGFTYNASTNEFRIEKVTDDVVIVVEGKQTFKITWMANGTKFAETTTAGSVVLPEGTPEGCDEQVFVGWTATANYSHATTAPTFVKNGDAVSEATTFYAVYATQGEGGEPEQATMEATFSSHKGWITTGTGGTSYWILVTGAYIASPNFSDLSKVTKIEFNMRTYGGANYKTVNVTTSGNVNVGSVDASTNSMDKKTINVSGLTGSGSFVFSSSTNTSSNGPGINNIVIYYTTSGGSTTNYTTSPDCEECTSAVTVTKGTASNGSFALDKTGEQSTCGGDVVVTVSSITPSDGYRFKEITQTGLTEGVTINQTAKTVTYAKKANGASTINVVFEAIPTYTIRFIDKGVQINEQEVLEGEAPEVPANPAKPCEAYTFKGWWTATLAADNKEAKEWISDFTATKDQNYYAIYSKTVGEEESKVAYMTFKKATSDGSDEYKSASDISNNLIASHDGIYTCSGSKLYAGTSGVKMGSKNSSGYITLTLTATASISKVVVDAAQYGSDSGNIEVEVGTTSLGTQSPATNLEFTTKTPIETKTITVSTTSKRAYVSAINIYTGGGSVTYYSSTVSCSETPTETIAVDGDSQAQKILRNGQLLILRDGKTYNSLGHLVE